MYESNLVIYVDFVMYVKRSDFAANCIISQIFRITDVKIHCYWK